MVVTTFAGREGFAKGKVGRVGRGQGSCYMSYNAEDSPPHPRINLASLNGNSPQVKKKKNLLVSANAKREYHFLFTHNF